MSCDASASSHMNSHSYWHVAMVAFRWAAALLDSDPELAHLRFMVVPSAVPETIFWRRYWRLAWSQLREHSLSLCSPAVDTKSYEPQSS